MAEAQTTIEKEGFVLTRSNSILHLPIQDTFYKSRRACLDSENLIVFDIKSKVCIYSNIFFKRKCT